MAILFNITHDANNLNEYDSTVTDGGDLSTGTPGLASTTAKMEALVDDTNAIYGRKNQTAPASNEIRWRFYLDPNSLADAFWMRILVLNPLWVQIRLQSAYSIVVWIKEDDTTWHNESIAISDDVHYIEFHLERGTGADGRIRTWVDGSLESTIDSLDITDNFDSLTSFDLGVIFTSGGTGTLHFDEFKANDDGGEIGPIGSFEQSVSGTLTSAGVLGRKTVVGHLGTLTSSGALMRQVSIGLAGILTSAGALAHKVSIGLMGTLTSSGALATAKKAYLALAGTLTSAGALERKIAIAVAGTLTSSGVLSTSRQFFQSLAGTLTSAGTLSRKTAVKLAGALTSTGALGRKVSLALASTLTSTGALGRKTSLALAGTLASAGELGRKIAIALAGMLTSSGTLGRHIAKTLAGTLTGSGTLVTSLAAAAARLYATIVDALTSGAAISTASVGGMIIADTRVDAATVDDA